MPIAAPRPCTYPGCPAMGSGGGSRCLDHKHILKTKVDIRRTSSSARGYGSKWQKERALYLQENPMCVMCKAEGKLKIAKVVDHKVAHCGDPTLFWDRNNWQSMCKKHHDSKTAKTDGGFGNPVGRGR